ncbi:MAG TPA: glycerol-3-phosphate 1-O-acyltransferase PlsY [Acidobacteriaceae bacterium]|jgi:glycerol-3-phosphate acyltransferase PlsY|nr:glycerol-3-phosphate 1-O-acyltransferase PlsY [Acidobacteriaceae bacterium]
MPVIFYLVAAVVAYLLGSIPFGYLLVRLFRKEDIRQKGSGNIGATNVMRSGSKGLGALTFLLDVLKGFCAVWLCGAYALHAGLSWNARVNAVAIAALCVVLGHIFTMWLGFRGGKGVATAFGVFIALAPWAALASVGVFAVVFGASRYVSLGSIVSALAFPIIAVLLPHAPRTPLENAVLVVIPLIVILKHHQNIGRLLSGTEYRFGKKQTTEPGTTAV